MVVTNKRRVGRLAASAALASAACLALSMSANPAYAAEEPALRASISEPAPVAPGGTGKVRYEVTNVSDEATEGILLNISLPRYVSLDSDKRCQQTGTNPEGGALISCNISDDLGKLAPGQTRVSDTPFYIAKNAPPSTELGKLGALVVPLKNGEPTEDYRDLDGHNVVWTPITTSGGTQDSNTAAFEWWKKLVLPFM